MDRIDHSRGGTGIALFRCENVRKREKDCIDLSFLLNL